MDIIWNVQVEYFVLSCGGCGWISLDNSAHVCHWYCREIQEEQVKDATIVVVALLDRKWTWWLRPWSGSMWHIANCNVMIGKNNSVLSWVKAQAPYIYSVGCPSHLVNICAKTAAKELSLSPEELLIDIYYYFEKSSKRREDLKEFQDFCNVAQQRVQKHCPTRWLSLGKGLDHLLNQWPAFSSYFESHSENQKSCDIQKRLTDPTMKFYTCFLHNVTQCFDTFN